MSTSISARTRVSCSPAAPAASHRPDRPLAGLARALLLDPDHGREVVQPHPGAPGRRHVRAVEQAARPGDDPQRGGERPGAQVGGGLAGQHVGRRTGSARVSRAAAAVGLDRLGEHAGELAQLAHARPQPGPLGVGDVRHPPAHVERRLEVVGGVGVGVRAPRPARRPAARSRQVRSCVAGPGEVQRERGGVGVEVGAEPLEHLAGGAVQAGAHPVGQPLVGRVAHQAVAEPQPVRPVGLEEVAERRRAWPRSSARPSAARVPRAPRGGSCGRAPRSSAGSAARAAASWSIWAPIAACTDSGSSSSEPGAQRQAGDLLDEERVAARPGRRRRRPRAGAAASPRWRR